MIKISNLSVSIDQQKILHSLDLAIAPGSLHVLMGPNGSGKSTLAYALMGHPNYHVDVGQITFNGELLNDLGPDKRAQKGLFLAFQHPFEIPGVTVFNFIKQSCYALTGQPMPVQEFQKMLEEKMSLLGIDPTFAQRALNCGFSGGEKKRLELLQLLMLAPQVAILDEIDSGLDVDGIKIVAQALALARQENPLMSIIIITHYPRLLSYLEPDAIHVMHKGTLIQSGTKELAHLIEQRGYDGICV
jgi:Fe-S cluster assembly ATP-binding protein